ncbi:protein cordon-bleu [Gastrophryne carolinensis]
MSVFVVWKHAKNYGFQDATASNFSGTKQHSLSLGDLTQKKSRDLGVSLGTYVVNFSKRLKARAPPPPQTTPRPRMELTSSTDSDCIEEESKENVLHRKVDLSVCLPDGQEKSVTVDGSKAVMDFMVDLCSQHHLNPAQYTLEACSGTSQQPFILRPNTLIGTLNVPTVFLKEKVTEVKVRKPAPKIPEKTIRLVVNYFGNQKAVVRVNPTVPLRNILPAVCEKCEFNHENVTLLRDPVSKEELDMSQSLNDLEIKELYAWNNRQEHHRNLSSSSDTAEKEKKGILGFFRGNKKGSKHETSIGHMDINDYEEVFKAASTSGNRCEGFLTAPSSPNANSRSIALGSSLSMSNISGIGAGAELKKRRAPPPPKPAPPSNTAEKSSEDKLTEPPYASVQKELQKKKRRAPPPPPTSQMPNEKIEDFDSGNSSTSNGRQVPQKPPRGISRSPPQLMIPPPPPYPPPDNDITDPPVFENGVAITGTTKPIPAKRGKKLIRSTSVTSEEVLATDDAGSLNSYTEDSGIVSSPSSSISLDLKIDGDVKKEKIINPVNYNDDTSQQLTRVESFTSEDTWSLNTSSTRVEDEASLVRNGDEDLFITTQFQDTLAELDEDSEDIDDVDHTESNHISPQSSPVAEEQHYCRESDAVVPVTIIDEIPEINTNSAPSNVQVTPPAKNYNLIHKSAILNNNNRVVDFNDKSAEKITTTAYTNIQSNTLSTVKPSGGSSEQTANDSKIPINKTEFNSSATYRLHSIEVRESNVPVSTTMQIASESMSLNEKPNLISAQKQKVENRIRETSKPPLWRQQTYEPKTGLTTFTVVPPKPQVKRYDRAASLSSSAIKIDDQGNLISPRSSLDIKDTHDNSNIDSEGPLVEKPLLKTAKEFWRSSSLEVQGVDSKDQHIKTSFLKNYKPHQGAESTVNVPSSKESISVDSSNARDSGLKKTKAVPEAVPHENMIIIENTVKKTDLPVSKPTLNYFQPKQANVTMLENKDTGEMGQKPAISDGVSGSLQKKVMPPRASQEKMIIVEKANLEKNELPFLKPSKRTSSQYVASAITKYTEPVNRKPQGTAEFNADITNNKTLPMTPALKKGINIPLEEKREMSQAVNKQEPSKDLGTKFMNLNGPLTGKLQPDNKIKNFGPGPTGAKRDNLVSAPQQFNSTTTGSKTSPEKLENYSADTLSRPTYNMPANAFLKAVREKSVKIETANSFGPIRMPVTPVTNIEKEDNNIVDSIPATLIDDPDSSVNIFGPKAKFRPVVQKSALKDNSLHSVLMEAIQSGEGKEKLRKIQSSPDGGERKDVEPENGRSALLSAIRAHNGAPRLKKVSSAASDELQSIRNTELSLIANRSKANETLTIPPSPVMPPPAPPPVLSPSPKSPPAFGNNMDAREALMEAIRSGQGGTRLRKVSASVRTL